MAIVLDLSPPCVRPCPHPLLPYLFLLFSSKTLSQLLNTQASPDSQDICPWDTPLFLDCSSSTLPMGCLLSISRKSANATFLERASQPPLKLVIPIHSICVLTPALFYTTASISVEHLHHGNGSGLLDSLHQQVGNSWKPQHCLS